MDISWDIRNQYLQLGSRRVRKEKEQGNKWRKSRKNKAITREGRRAR
jgi:hypothetical protein